MGLTKTEHFTERQNQLSKCFKALGHPARVAILEVLMKSKSCICNDIVDELPLAQATVSQHLRELKEAGIIKGNIEGNAICYCIDFEALNTIFSNLQSLTKADQGSSDKCC
jgi:ArsR family transcriptional regulator, arsenate/arsenite/antimonite-responsive transcriptional repressor